MDGATSEAPRLPVIPTSNTIPYTAKPWVTGSLIGLCVAAFLYQVSLSGPAEQAFIETYALVPARLSPASLLTSMFLHGGFMHILSNMWTLWVFGPALEDRLGSRRFLALYLVSGLAASLLHIIANWSSAVPALGASGAIAGVIAAYARRFPYAWVNILQPIVVVPVFFMMPALLFAGLWFASQVMQGVGSLALPSAAAGIAWWAHVGGFLAGWFLVRRLAPEASPSEEMQSAARSALWPWTTWMRWTTWWWRRR
jgi:membrane associated rhomboid family serine protease